MPMAYNWVEKRFDTWSLPSAPEPGKRGALPACAASAREGLSPRQAGDTVESVLRLERSNRDTVTGVRSMELPS